MVMRARSVARRDPSGSVGVPEEDRGDGPPRDDRRAGTHAFAGWPEAAASRGPDRATHQKRNTGGVFSHFSVVGGSGRRSGCASGSRPGSAAAGRQSVRRAGIRGRAEATAVVAPAGAPLSRGRPVIARDAVDEGSMGGENVRPHALKSPTRRSHHNSTHRGQGREARVLSLQSGRSHALNIHMGLDRRRIRRCGESASFGLQRNAPDQIRIRRRSVGNGTRSEARDDRTPDSLG